MSNRPKTRWSRLILFVLAAAVGGGAAWIVFDGRFSSAPTVAASSNAILVIAPYRHAGTWVFDDPAAGLKQEPFVAGVPEMIDVLVKDVPDAENGFRMLFSARPFPDYHKKLTWLRGSMGGNYYRLEEPPMEGWICPAMFKYYDAPPAEIYVKAEPLKR